MARSSDLGDSGDKANQLQAAGDSSPKFHEQIYNFDNTGLKMAALTTKIADTSSSTDSPSSPENTEAESSGKILDMLRKENPAELSPNLRAMQGLVENFATADDKSKALEQFRGAFEKTIKQSDDDLVKANDTWNKESPKLAPEYQAKSEKLNKTAEVLAKVAETIPEDKKEHMQSVVQLWSMGEQNSPQLRRALEAEMGQTKGLAAAVKDSFQAVKEAQPIMEKVGALQGAIKQAVEDRVVSRMIYAEVLQEGGDAKGAKQMQIESMAIQMNVPLEQVKDLSSRQDQKKTP